MFWLGLLLGGFSGAFAMGLVAGSKNNYQDGWQDGYTIAQMQNAEKEKCIKEQEKEYNKENESSDN